MNYELAKELQGAGFPQRDGFYVSEGNRSAGGSDEQVRELAEMIGDREGWAYQPTLSELIEACGFDFRDLSLHSKRTPESTYNRWIVRGGKQKFGHWILRNGRTPEEAVARLWLSINRKA